MEQLFYIGQKVVCIDNSKKGNGNTHPISSRIKIGDMFTVLGLRKGCCSGWFVDIGLKTISGAIECPLCGYTYKSVVLWIYHFRFAPINESFEDITFERVMEDEKVSVN